MRKLLPWNLRFTPVRLPLSVFDVNVGYTQTPSVPVVVDFLYNLSVRLSVTFVHCGHRVQWIPDIFACLDRWMNRNVCNKYTTNP